MVNVHVSVRNKTLVVLASHCFKLYVANIKMYYAAFELQYL